MSENALNLKLPDQLDLKNIFPEISYQEWKELVEKELKGIPFEKKLITKTYEGIELNPLYTRQNIKENKLKDIPAGFEPYIRGTSYTGYVLTPWQIAQNIFSKEVFEANKILKNSLKNGQNSINIVIADTSTSSKGLRINKIQELDELFNDIDLENYPINFYCNKSAISFTILFISWLKQRNFDLKKISGSISTDPINYAIKEGKLFFESKKDTSDFINVFKLIKDYLPEFKSVYIDGSIYQNAGGNLVQELAFSLSTAVHYINLLIKNGFEIDDVAPRIRFNFGISSNFFMEIAKFRAARYLWCNIIDAYNGNETSKKMNIFAKTSFSNQTITDPYVNMLRSTTEAFSAVLGGVDGIQTIPFNEIFSEVDDFSARIARNIQIILKEEVNLNKLIDPAGGSYFLEELTNDFSEKTWELFQKIESSGGILECIKNNFIQSEVEKIKVEKIKDYAKRKSILVGTNMYPNLKENIKDYIKPNETSDKQTEKTELSNELSNAVDKYLINRDFDSLLKMINSFSKDDSFIELSKNLEISDEVTSISKLEEYRFSIPFEELRLKSENLKTKLGSAPKVFLLTMGPLSQFKPRADFSKGFFEVGGFEVIYPNGFENISEAIEQLKDSKAKLAVICSTDDTYPELVPLICDEVKKQELDIKLILAGYPKDYVEQFKAKGVEYFIYLGADVVQILNSLLNLYE